MLQGCVFPEITGDENRLRDNESGHTMKLSWKLININAATGSTVTEESSCHKGHTIYEVESADTAAAAACSN